MSWRAGGVGPEKTSAGLRGIGLIAVVVAFLAVSNGYVSGGDDDTKASTPRVAGRALVLAPAELRPGLTRAVPGATYRFLPVNGVRRALEDNESADVVVAAAADVDALVRERRCAGDIAVAARGGTSFAACLPTSVDADASLGRRYLVNLTGLRARAALIDAGLDVPTR